jgi:hypothetical protein
MAKLSKLVLTALGGAALLGGCATGPYYDNYGSPYGYNSPYYGSNASPYYGSNYDPYYYGPSVGFGYSYSNNDNYRDGRYRGNNWRDRDGRWRNRDGDPVPNPNDTRQWIDRSNDQVGGPNTDRRRGESGG